MKKILLFLFFILFIGLLFTWNDSMAEFWKAWENRSFLVQEFFAYMKRYSSWYEWLQKYMPHIIGISIFLIGSFFLRHFLEKRKEQIKNNPLTHGKTVIDGNSILSASSLPKSEKKQEKQKKEWPFLPSEKTPEKSEEHTPKQNDVTLEDMQSLLEKK